jgi:transcriptional regulator with XRE-family HTH domain
LSSIAKHSPHDGLRGGALGREIRRRRLALGLSQGELGRPLTRAFVSAVERGHCLPSLAALVHFAGRLGVSAGELLDSVNPPSTGVYTAEHENVTRRHQQNA